MIPTLNKSDAIFVLARLFGPSFVVRSSLLGCTNEANGNAVGAGFTGINCSPGGSTCSDVNNPSYNIVAGTINCSAAALQPLDENESKADNHHSRLRTARNVTRGAKRLSRRAKARIADVPHRTRD